MVVEVPGEGEASVSGHCPPQPYGSGATGPQPAHQKYTATLPVRRSDSRVKWMAGGDGIGRAWQSSAAGIALLDLAPDARVVGELRLAPLRVRQVE
jgi:hypothetical protein